MLTRLFRVALRRLTLVESLVITLIVIALGVLLAQQPMWAASGNIRVPVRVFVFDAVRGRPVPEARVAIFRAPPLTDLNTFDAVRNNYDPGRWIGPAIDLWQETTADGTVLIEQNFRTGANHERPEMRADVNYFWVSVQAADYGGAVVPLRHDTQPTAILRKHAELIIPVGLTPLENPRIAHGGTDGE